MTLRNGKPTRLELHARFKELQQRGLTLEQMEAQTGYAWRYISRVLRDPEGVRDKRNARNLSLRRKFEREVVRVPIDLADADYPGAPDRSADVDVSGADGIRFVVIPVSMKERGEEQNGRAGWTVFDTYFKRRVGMMRIEHRTAWTDCRYYNARENADDVG